MSYRKMSILTLVAMFVVAAAFAQINRRAYLNEFAPQLFR